MRRFLRCIFHHIHTDALIAIHEGAVRDERIAYSSALFLLGRVEFLPAKTGKDILQCGLQQSLIPDADAPASFLGNKLVKWKALLSFGAIPFPDFGTGKKAGVHKMVMDLGPNGKHIAGCHIRFRHEDISAAGGTELCGPAASISYFGRIYNSR